MPADRPVRSLSPDPAPPTATATRNEYARRRLSTAAGLHELRQWRRTSAVLVVYTAAVIAALRYGAVAVSTDTLHTAWVDLINTRTITDAVVKATFTLTVVLTLPLAGSAASVVVRLRPWRPHSGRSIMWASPPQRLRSDWPAWRAAAQAHMLTDHAPSPNPAALQSRPRPQRGHPVHLVKPAPEPPQRPVEPEPEPEPQLEPEPRFEPQPKPGPPPEPEPEPEPPLEPEPKPEPPPEPEPKPDIHLLEPQPRPESEPPPKPEPKPDIHLLEPQPRPESEPPPKPEPEAEVPLVEATEHADARLLDAMAQVGVDDVWTDDLAGEEWEDQEAQHDELPALPGEPDAPVPAVSAPSPPESEQLVFWLFGPNRVSAERESMLALMVANNRRLHLKDGARILGLEPATLRMRFSRAAKDGWTKHSGISYWSLSDRVTTDLEMLITSVADGDEHMASQIAERIGPPLPSLRAEWIDNRAGGLTPREELRAAADAALAQAAELWPTNRTFADAADRLYADD